MDPFEVLGLPRKFALDMKGAEAKHLELSRALHPDKYASSGANERRMALSRAIEVNEAFRAVRDPVRRAEAILRLGGLDGEIGETREPKPSGEFLMEVLEAREALDEAKSKKDAAEIGKILAQSKRQFSDVSRALGEALDGSRGDREKLRAAIPMLGKLRYATRFMSEAQSADDELAGF